MKLSKKCRVSIIGDRHIIETDARRAEAILLVLSGCTLKEAGDRFGITRQRIQQYLKDAGLTTKVRTRSRRESAAVRKDWARFHRPTRHKVKTRERMQQAVEAVRSFTATHQRAPRYHELAQALGIKGFGKTAAPYLIGWLGRRHWETSPQAIRRLHLVYHAAGFVGKQPRAYHSHIDPLGANQRGAATRRQTWANYTPEEKAQRMAHLRVMQVRVASGDLSAPAQLKGPA